MYCICTWHILGVQQVSTGYLLYTPGMYWYIPGMYWVCIQYIPGMYPVHTWYLLGTYLVFLGTYLVCIYLICTASTAVLFLTDTLWGVMKRLLDLCDSPLIVFQADYLIKEGKRKFTLRCNRIPLKCLGMNKKKQNNFYSAETEFLKLNGRKTQSKE